MTDFRGRGFAIADIRLTPDQCDHLAASIPTVASGRGGVRDLLHHPTVLQLLRHKQLGDYLWSLVGRELVAVNARLLDKTPEANWRVAWHQDRMIAVREQREVAGYGPWSFKSGVPHVEPPSAVLQQMLAVRVHLDPSGVENGPLRVIPGSHELGKIADGDVAGAVAMSEPFEIAVDRGTIVVMRPLLLHASSPSRTPAHRRVLHIELAPIDAISPLHWDQPVHLTRAAELPLKR